QELVDGALEGGAAVVRPVDRASELDEARPEVLTPLTEAKLVLDVPQLLVHLPQLRRQSRQLRRLSQAPARLGQRLQLGADVPELGGVADALALDLQDGQPVEQVAGGHL